MKMVFAVCAREDFGSSQEERNQAVDEGIARAIKYAGMAFPARQIPDPVIHRFESTALVSWSSDPVGWSLQGYSAMPRRAVDGVGYTDPSYKGTDAARSDGLLQFSTRLGGCFNLFRSSDNSIEAVTDATKSNSVYIAGSDRLWILSSRASLAHMVAGHADRPTFDLHALSTFPAKGYIIGDGTPFEGVSAAGIAEHISISPRGVFRSSAIPVAEAESANAGERDWNGVVTAAASSLVNAFDSLADSDVNFSLTGGRDSRVIAAALAQHGGINVITSTMGVPSDPDVVLAAEIAGICGWSHDITPPSRVSEQGTELLAEEPLDRITRILDVHDAMNSAWDDVEDYGPVNPTAIMSGVGGEILRGGLVLTSHEELSADLARRELRAAIGDSAFVAPQFLSTYADKYVELVEESAFRAVDDFYYHERNGRWVASRRMGARFRRRVIDPLVDNRFVRATRQIDPRVRWEERLAFEIVARLYPPLRDLRMEGNRWRFERSRPHPDYAEGWAKRSELTRDRRIAQFNVKNLTDASMRRRVDELILDGLESGPAAELLDRTHVEKYLAAGNKYPSVRWHLATTVAMLSEPWFETTRPDRREAITVSQSGETEAESAHVGVVPQRSADPLISVIVPMYNAEQHIQDTLASLASQSFIDFEVIVVDDGSTDNSRAIVDAFSSRDDRFLLVESVGGGSAGAARNVGLGLARGEYLTFLDADDLFAPSMLAKMFERAQSDGADVVLTGFNTLHDVTGEVKPQRWALRTAHMPPQMSFAPEEVADHLFYITNPANWNKMFRRAFVEENQISFQTLRRANDAYFTYFSLAMASRISVVDETLVLYRVGNTSSLQGSIHETPLEFIGALDGLFQSLNRVGRFERHKRAFQNLVASMSLGALGRACTIEAFTATYKATREALFVKYGLNEAPANTYLSPYLRRRVAEILAKPVENWLFDRVEDPSGANLARRIDPLQTPYRIEQADAVSVATPPKPNARQPDVSVVVPVYNAAAWLHECLLSILGQSSVSIEVICVNDGSTDESARILHEYATSDPRVRVIDQPNGGLSVARNTGMAAATGRYTCLIDSDDYWKSDSLAELVERADRDELDVLLFDAESFFDAGVSEASYKAYATYYTRKRSYDDVVDGPRLIADMDRERDYRPSACLYLFRSAGVREAGLTFIPGIMHEDNPFTFALLMTAKRAAHVKMPIYARRVRPGSIMTGGAAQRSMQGYFTAYLSMTRVAARVAVPEDVAPFIGDIVYRVLSGARRLFLELPAESGDRIRLVDTSAEAHSMFRMMQHERNQIHKLKKLSKGA